VRRTVKEKFVAVTRSVLHSSGYASEDRFWDKLAKQGVRFGNSIGIMCTADGKWLGDQDIDKALAAWNNLPADERRPGAVQIEDRGPFDPARGVEPPPGALIIRGFIRELQRDKQGQLSAPRNRSELQAGGKTYEILEEPNRDFLWLTAVEWKSLVPKAPKVGDRVALPTSIRERIVRFHLVDSAKGLPGCWQRDRVRAADITLAVTEVSADAVRLRLEGSAVMMDAADRSKAGVTADLRLLGYLDYDRKADAFSRFDILALGCFRVKRSDGEGQKSAPTALGFAYELARGVTSTNVIPPRGTRLVSGSSESLADYFRGAPGVIQAVASK
jgi:hypothetical protein